jgi:hypothetical protein
MFKFVNLSDLYIFNYNYVRTYFLFSAILLSSFSLELRSSKKQNYKLFSSQNWRFYISVHKVEVPRSDGFFPLGVKAQFSTNLTGTINHSLKCHLFFSQQYWILTHSPPLGRQVLYPLVHTPSPFCFRLFFMPLPRVSLGPLSSLAGMTSVHCHAWLIYWDGVLLTFCLSWT